MSALSRPLANEYCRITRVTRTERPTHHSQRRRTYPPRESADTDPAIVTSLFPLRRRQVGKVLLSNGTLSVRRDDGQDSARPGPAQVVGTGARLPPSLLPKTPFRTADQFAAQPSSNARKWNTWCGK